MRRLAPWFAVGLVACGAPARETGGGVAQSASAAPEPGSSANAPSPAEGKPAAAPGGGASPAPHCDAYAMVGPFPKPEDACPALHAALKQCPECQCWVVPGSRHATPLGEAAVLELRTEGSGGNWVSGYALALQQKQGWYASSRFPSVLHELHEDGGTESVGVLVIGRPKVDAGKRPEHAGAPVVDLSLQKTECRVPKGHEDKRPPCAIPYDAKRTRAIGCFRRPKDVPACTDVDGEFDAPDVDADRCVR